MGTALPDFGPNLISFVTTQFVIIVVFFILAFLVAFLQINQLIKQWEKTNMENRKMLSFVTALSFLVPLWNGTRSIA